MKADIPDKILISRDEDGKIHHSYWTTDQELVPFEDTIYIRKDIVDETIKTAEDHAYFAGQEKFREKLLKCINEIRAIPHENAIVRDLTFQEVVNKLNSM